MSPSLIHSLYASLVEVTILIWGVNICRRAFVLSLSHKSAKVLQQKSSSLLLS